MEAKISFSVTTYEGFEDDVLRLRNRNRPDSKTREYMDWRYLGESSSAPSLIFWACDVSGSPVGMAPVIFRKYWMDGLLCDLAVFGDVSLNTELRGKDVGRGLINFANLYLKSKANCCSFVIPNQALQKSLLSTGWNKPEPFFWYLWLLDPAGVRIPFLNCKLSSDLIATIYRKIMFLFLISTKPKLVMRKAETFDLSFDSFWHSYPKKGIIIRDRSPLTLKWRYKDHPINKYEIRTFFYDSQMKGYIVFIVENNGTCRIVDILVKDIRFIKPIMKLILLELWRNTNVKIVRLKLSNDHIYDHELKCAGCIKRYQGDVFQTNWDSRSFEKQNYKWFLTIGDKDT